MIVISIFRKNVEDIDLNDINDLISQSVRESSILEYKNADFLHPNNSLLDQQFWKTIKIFCGFANNMGGILILGIEENGNSCAQSITPLHQIKTFLINKLRGLILSHTIPSISLKIQDIDTDSTNPDDYILVLKILEAPEPVMYINSRDSDSNKYFFRYNEDTIPADPITLRLLFSKKNIEEKLTSYLEQRNYGLNIGEEENVVSWIAIPYQFPLDTFMEINNQTISTLVNLFPRAAVGNRFHAIIRNGKTSHNGILFRHLSSQHYDLYEGFLEVKKSGYIEFRAVVAQENDFINEKYIIEDFTSFIEFLYNFYSHYDYYGDIKLILSIKKDSRDYKLGKKDITGEYIPDTPNNFCLDNRIHIEKVILIDEIELRELREEVFSEFKKELYTCFGLS